MNQAALATSLAGLVSTFGGIGIYFYKIKKNAVPVFPTGLLLSLVIGMSLGAYALYLAIQGEAMGVAPVAVPAFISISMGAFFMWVLTQRKTPIGNIKVQVGDSVLPFTAPASTGEPFSSDDFQGKRTLFKFFRGAWCPYCSAELTLFEEMKPKLEKFGVSVVALSGDTVAEAAMHKERDGLSHTLLTDPDLTVIQQYGVEHQKALGADSKNTFLIFGIPFPKTFKFKSMSIPTSLLVDEEGTIRWIDQSEDYRLRASEEAVLKAVSHAFGERSG